MNKYFFEISKNFLSQRRNLNLRIYTSFHSLVSFDRAVGIFIDAHSSINLFIFFPNKAEKFPNQII